MTREKLPSQMGLDDHMEKLRVLVGMVRAQSWDGVPDGMARADGDSTWVCSVPVGFRNWSWNLAEAVEGLLAEAGRSPRPVVTADREALAKALYKIDPLGVWPDEDDGSTLQWESLPERRRNKHRVEADHLLASGALQPRGLVEAEALEEAAETLLGLGGFHAVDHAAVRLVQKRLRNRAAAKREEGQR